MGGGFGHAEIRSRSTSSEGRPPRFYAVFGPGVLLRALGERERYAEPYPYLILK